MRSTVTMNPGAKPANQRSPARQRQALEMLGVALLMAVAAFLATAPPAPAATAYQHTGEVFEDSSVFTDQSRPQQMAVDPANGNLFVADHGQQQIHVFAPDGDSVGHLTSFGDSTVIARPLGIGVDPNNGDIYVGAAGNSDSEALVRFTQNTALDPDDPARYEHDDGFELSSTLQIGSLGSTSPGTFATPQPGGIAIHPGPNPGTGRADILILDPGNDRVHRFDAEGSPVEAYPAPLFGSQSHFDGPGSEPFSDVRSIATDADGDFTVADAPGGNLRITTFEPDGDALDTHSPLPDTLSNGVAVAAKPVTGETFASRSPGSQDAEIFQYETGSRVATLGLPGAHGRVQAMVASGQNPDGRLYATATTSSAWPAFGGGVLALHAFDDLGVIPDPPEVTIEAVDSGEVTDSTAVFRGTVDPNGGETHWRFEYRSTDPDASQDWTELPLSEDPETGNQPVDVEAEAAGLEPATPYEVRLFADSGFGQVAVTEAPHPEFETEPVAPVAQTGDAWSVSAHRATLAATVDPRNAETEYIFEYGTDSGYGTQTASRSAGDGGSPAVVTAEVDGLQPGTTYHFRIVARNVEYPAADLGDSGADATFTTRSAAETELPRRGYELASRVDANGISAWPIRASDTGDAYVYFTVIPSPGAENAGGTTQRMLRQEGGTWQADAHTPTTPVDPEAGSLGNKVGPLLSADLSVGGFQTAGGYHGLDQNGVNDIYTRDTGTGKLTWLSRDRTLGDGVPDTAAVPANTITYLSPDGSSAVFHSRRSLLPTDESSTSTVDTQLYQWDAGTLRHVSIDPATGVSFTSRSELGRDSLTRNAVSGDGQRIVFTTDNRLYMRIDGSETREIGGGENALYFGADSETREVIYLRDGTLYRYDFALGQSSAISPDVDGVFYVSEDANRVYFDSTTKLADGGTEGQRALYLAERTIGAEAHAIRFIGDLHPDDLGLLATRGQSHNTVDGTADGAILAFTSKAGLVPGRKTGGFPQVYIYEAELDRLYCASCPPDGSVPSGRGDIGAKQVGTAGGGETGSWLLNTLASPYMPAWRNVTESGSVFFQSDSRLVTGDANDAFDVYEWRGGQLQLISSGTGSAHQLFGDASPDGQTVFFTSPTDFTSQGAVARVRRIWAAREGGGWVPPERHVDCTGDECRDPAQAPAEISPGTKQGEEPRAASPGDRPALRRCAALAQRFVAVKRRAIVLRRAALRSDDAGRRRAIVKRYRLVVRRAVVLRRATIRCRRAVR